MAQKKGIPLLDRLSIFFLAATGVVCLCYAVLLAWPNNPLAAPTPVLIAKAPTPLPTATPEPPTLTPTATRPRITNTPVVIELPTTPTIIGPTNTLRPTITRPPTYTPTPTWGPSPTVSPTRSKFPFVAEIIPQVSPYGCTWSGIAGVVNDLAGMPAPGYIVHVWGDADIDKTLTAGNSQFLRVPGYDASAWDLPINAGNMVAGTWFVRLYKPGSNTPVSDEYTIRLEPTCGGCFMLVRFLQNH